MSVSLWRYRHLVPIPGVRQPVFRRTWACGLLYNEHALWVGVHYSAPNKRYCINLLPFLTFWYCAEGGREA